MKITRTTERRLTTADIDAIRRMRQTLNDCQFAYVNNDVCVLLLTDSENTDELLSMAREQMDCALSNHPDYVTFNACGGGSAMVLLKHGQVLVFSEPGADYKNLGTQLHLRGIGLEACEHMPVLAVVTGESMDVSIDPDDLLDAEDSET